MFRHIDGSEMDRASIATDHAQSLVTIQRCYGERNERGQGNLQDALCAGLCRTLGTKILSRVCDAEGTVTAGRLFSPFMWGRACRNRRPSLPSVPPQSIDHPEICRRWGLRRPRGRRTRGAAAGPKKGGERTRRPTTMCFVAFRFFFSLLVYFSEKMFSLLFSSFGRSSIGNLQKNSGKVFRVLLRSTEQPPRYFLNIQQTRYPLR